MRRFISHFCTVFVVLFFVLSILGYSFTVTKYVTPVLQLSVSTSFLRTEKAIYSLIISDINILIVYHAGHKRERRKFSLSPIHP